MRGEGCNLLVLGHPGHELRAYGWIAHTRPRVCILTDGGGNAETPRLDHSIALLRDLGAEPGSICGKWTDRTIYEFILAGYCEPFARLVGQLADILIDHSVTTVVSDGIEGYNPTHDLCEVLTTAAVAVARAQGHHVNHYVIPLMGDPRLPPGFERSLEAEYHLTDQQFTGKKQAAHGYAGHGGQQLLREIDDSVRRFGEATFRCERLFTGASALHPWSRLFGGNRPFYEEYGERQIASGRYQVVIRFTQHVLPLFQHLCTPRSEIAESARI